MGLFNRLLIKWRRASATLTARMALMAPIAFVAVMAVCAGPAHAAVLVTILEGEATLIDGHQALSAAEGVAVDDETLVHTDARTNVLRLEWPDGSAADLGPDTQVMVNPRKTNGRPATEASLYLLRGWVKLSAPDKGRTPDLLSPQLEVKPFDGALVLMSLADETWAFSETGRVTLIERNLKPASSAALKRGEAYSRAGDGRGTVSARPAPGQLQRVPRGFRAELPLRRAAFEGRNVDAKPAPTPTYADLEGWLSAERTLRRPFVRRFSALTRDRGFRNDLAKHLRSHPEWEPVLFPERFVKPTPTPPPR
jgi:hypothetical protein